MENPACLALLYQFVNTRIAIIQPLERIQRIGTFGLLSTTLDLQILTTIPDHAQPGLAQQVHLEQPEILDRIH